MSESSSYPTTLYNYLEEVFCLSYALLIRLPYLAHPAGVGILFNPGYSLYSDALVSRLLPHTQIKSSNQVNL